MVNFQSNKIQIQLVLGKWISDLDNAYGDERYNKCPAETYEQVKNIRFSTFFLLLFSSHFDFISCPFYQSCKFSSGYFIQLVLLCLFFKENSLWIFKFVHGHWLVLGDKQLSFLLTFLTIQKTLPIQRTCGKGVGGKGGVLQPPVVITFAKIVLTNKPSDLPS